MLQRLAEAPKSVPENKAKAKTAGTKKKKNNKKDTASVIRESNSLYSPVSPF